MASGGAVPSRATCPACRMIRPPQFDLLRNNGDRPHRQDRPISETASKAGLELLKYASRREGHRDNIALHRWSDRNPAESRARRSRFPCHRDGRNVRCRRCRNHPNCVPARGARVLRNSNHSLCHVDAASDFWRRATMRCRCPRRDPSTTANTARSARCLRESEPRSARCLALIGVVATRRCALPSAAARMYMWPSSAASSSFSCAIAAARCPWVRWPDKAAILPA